MAGTMKAPRSPGLLRPSSTVSTPAEPPIVLRIDPADGECGVFRDSPVVICLSDAADPRSFVGSTFQVEVAGGECVPGVLSSSPDGYVLFWTPIQLLRPGALHFVTVCGVRDLRGREVVTHRSRFVPCDLTLLDLLTR